MNKLKKKNFSRQIHQKRVLLQSFSQKEITLKNLPFFLRYALLTGVLAGTTLTLIALFLAFAGLNPLGQYELMFLNPTLLIFTFLGLRFYRFRYNKGFLEGWRAVSMGIAIVVAVALLYALGNWCIFSFSESTLTLYKADSAKVLENLRNEQETVNTDNLAASIAEISPFAVAFQSYIRTFALGMFFALLSVLFVKKSKPEGENNLA